MYRTDLFQNVLISRLWYRNAYAKLVIARTFLWYNDIKPFNTVCRESPAKAGRLSSVSVGVTSYTACPASCLVLMGGGKGTVWAQCWHLLATGAAFTVKAAAWPTAQASRDGRCRPFVTLRKGGTKMNIMNQNICAFFRITPSYYPDSNFNTLHFAFTVGTSLSWRYFPD